MSEPPDRERVLIPLRILEGQTLDDDLVALLSPIDVVLLGYHVVPEQTAPSQMRQQFEPQARKAVEAIEDSIEAAGGTVESRLLFTHEAEQSIDRVGEETEATALAIPNPAAPVESIVVPLRGEVNAARIATFVSRIRADRDIEITLFAAGDEAQLEAADRLVEVAAEALVGLGVPKHAIRRVTESTETPVDAIIETALAHDMTVMGEREPDWRSIVFGELEERVAAESLGPVLVVQDHKLDA